MDLAQMIYRAWIQQHDVAEGPESRILRKLCVEDPETWILAQVLCYSSLVIGESLLHAVWGPWPVLCYRKQFGILGTEIGGHLTVCAKNQSPGATPTTRARRVHNAVAI